MSEMTASMASVSSAINNSREPPGMKRILYALKGADIQCHPRVGRLPPPGVTDSDSQTALYPGEACQTLPGDKTLQCRPCEPVLPLDAPREHSSDKVCPLPESNTEELAWSVRRGISSENQDESVDDTLLRSDAGEDFVHSVSSDCALKTLPLLEAESRNSESINRISVSSDTSYPVGDVDMSTEESTLKMAPQQICARLGSSACVANELKCHFGAMINKHDIQHEPPGDADREAGSSITMLKSLTSNQPYNSEVYNLAACQEHSNVILANVDPNKSLKYKTACNDTSESINRLESTQLHRVNGSPAQDGIIASPVHASPVTSEPCLSPQAGLNGCSRDISHRHVAMTHAFQTGSTHSDKTCNVAAICTVFEPDGATAPPALRTSQNRRCQSLPPEGVQTVCVARHYPVVAKALAETTSSLPHCISSLSTNSEPREPTSLTCEHQLLLSKGDMTNSVAICPTCSPPKNEVPNVHSVYDNPARDTAAKHDLQLESQLPESQLKAVVNGSIPERQHPVVIRYTISRNYNAEFEKYILRQTISQNQGRCIEVTRSVACGVVTTTPATNCLHVSDNIPINNTAVFERVSAIQNISSNDKGPIYTTVNITANNEVNTVQPVMCVSGYNQTQVTSIAPTLQEMVQRKIVRSKSMCDVEVGSTVNHHSPPLCNDPTGKCAADQMSSRFEERLALTPVSDTQNQIPQSHAFPASSAATVVAQADSVISRSIQEVCLPEDQVSPELQQHINRRAYHYIQGGRARGTAKQKQMSANLPPRELKEDEDVISSEPCAIPTTGRGSIGGHTNKMRSSRGRGRGHGNGAGLTPVMDSTGLGLEKAVSVVDPPSADQISQRGQVPKRAIKRRRRTPRGFPIGAGHRIAGHLVPLYPASNNPMTTEGEWMKMDGCPSQRFRYMPSGSDLTNGSSTDVVVERSLIPTCVETLDSAANDTGAIDAQRQMCLPRNASTIKSLMNRPMLHSVQPYRPMHDGNEEARHTSSRDSEMGHQVRVECSNSSSVSLSSLSTSLREERTEPSGSNMIHPTLFSHTQRSQLLLTPSHSTLPSDLCIPTHARCVDNSVTSSAATETHFPPAVSITSKNVIQQALSSNINPMMGELRSNVTFPMPVIPPVPSSHNPALLHHNLQNSISATMEQPLRSLSVAMTPKAVGPFNRRKSTGSVGMSRSPHTNSAPENVIDLTGESETDFGTESHQPLLSNPLPHTGNFPVPHPSPEAPMVASQMPLNLNMSKNPPEVAQRNTTMIPPTSLPEHVYFSRVVPLTGVADCSASSRGSQQTFASVHAPTVLSLLNKKPVYNTSVQRGLPQTTPSPATISVNAPGNETCLVKPNVTPNQPAKAHQEQHKETLRLTHLMTPPLAHTKPCTSDILIEPAPPDVPLGHVNMFLEDKLRAENNFQQATTLKDLPITVPHSPRLPASSEEGGGQSPFLYGHEHSLLSQVPGTSAKVNNTLVCHSKNKVCTKVQPTALPNHMICTNISPMSTLAFQPHGSSSALVKTVDKCILKVPAPKRAISLATEKMLLSCPHPVAEHDSPIGCLPITLLLKATLQKPCCQHLTGVPPPAHTKVSNTVRKETPLDLRASASVSPTVDLGLDLRSRQLQLHLPSNNTCPRDSANLGMGSTSEALKVLHQNPILPMPLVQSSANILPMGFENYHRESSPIRVQSTSKNDAEVPHNLSTPQWFPVVIDKVVTTQNKEIVNDVNLQRIPISQKEPLIDPLLKSIEDAKRQCVKSIHLPTMIPVVVEQLDLTLNNVLNIPSKVGCQGLTMNQVSLNELKNVTNGAKKRLNLGEPTLHKVLQIGTVVAAHSVKNPVQPTVEEPPAVFQEGNQAVTQVSEPFGQRRTNSLQISISKAMTSEAITTTVQSLPIVAVHLQNQIPVEPANSPKCQKEKAQNVCNAQKKQRKSENKSKSVNPTDETDLCDTANGSPPNQSKSGGSSGNKKINANNIPRWLLLSEATADIPLPADQLVAHPTLVAPISGLIEPLLRKRNATGPNVSNKRQRRKGSTQVKAKKSTQTDETIPKGTHPVQGEPSPDKPEWTRDLSVNEQPKRTSVTKGSFKNTCLSPGCSTVMRSRHCHSKEGSSGGPMPSTTFGSVASPIQTTPNVVPLLIEASIGKSSPVANGGNNTKEDLTTEHEQVGSTEVSTKEISTLEHHSTTVPKKAAAHFENCINNDCSGLWEHLQQKRCEAEQIEMDHTIRDEENDVCMDDVSSQGHSEERTQMTECDTRIKAEMAHSVDNVANEFSHPHVMPNDGLYVGSSSERPIIGYVISMQVSDKRQWPDDDDKGEGNEMKTSDPDLLEPHTSDLKDNLDDADEHVMTEVNLKLVLSDSDSTWSATSCNDIDSMAVKSEVEIGGEKVLLNTTSPREKSLKVEQKDSVRTNQAHLLSSDSELDLPSFSAYLERANKERAKQKTRQHLNTEKNDGIMDHHSSGRGQPAKSQGAKLPKGKKAKNKRAKDDTITNQLLDVIDELPDIRPVKREETCIVILNSNNVASCAEPGDSTDNTMQSGKDIDISPYKDCIRPCHVIIEQYGCSSNKNRKYTKKRPKSKKRRPHGESGRSKSTKLKCAGIQQEKQHYLKGTGGKYCVGSGNESSTSAYSDGGNAEILVDFVKSEPIDIKESPVQVCTSSSIEGPSTSNMDTNSLSTELSDQNQKEICQTSSTEEVLITTAIVATTDPVIVPDSCTTDVSAVSIEYPCVNGASEKTDDVVLGPAETDVGHTVLINSITIQVTTETLSDTDGEKSTTSVTEPDKSLAQPIYQIIMNNYTPACKDQNEGEDLKSDCETNQRVGSPDAAQGSLIAVGSNRDTTVGQVEEICMHSDEVLGSDQENEHANQLVGTQTHCRQEAVGIQAETSIESKQQCTDSGEGSTPDKGLDTKRKKEQESDVDIEVGNVGGIAPSNAIPSSSDSLSHVSMSRGTEIEQGKDCVEKSKEQIQAAEVEVDNHDLERNSNHRCESVAADSVGSNAGDKTEAITVGLITDAMKDNVNKPVQYVDSQKETTRDEDDHGRILEDHAAKDGMKADCSSQHHMKETDSVHVGEAMDNQCAQSKKLAATENDALKEIARPGIEADQLVTSTGEVTDSQLNMLVPGVDAVEDKQHPLAKKANELRMEKCIQNGLLDASLQMSIVKKRRVDTNNGRESGPEIGFVYGFDDQTECEGCKPEGSKQKDSVPKRNPSESAPNQQDILETKLKPSTYCLESKVKLSTDCLETELKPSTNCSETTLKLSTDRPTLETDHLNVADKSSRSRFQELKAKSSVARLNRPKLAEYDIPASLVNPVAADKPHRPKSRDCKAPDWHAGFSLAKQVDPSGDVLHESVNTQIDGLETQTAKIVGLQVREECFDEQKLLGVFHPVQTLGGLRSETKNLQKEKEISMKKRAAVKLNQIDSGKTCYVGLRKLDGILDKCGDQKGSGFTPAKCFKDCDSTQLVPTLATVASKPNEKVNKESTTNKLLSGVNDQASILEMLQRDMSENRPIALPEDDDDDDQMDDSVMPPLTSKGLSKDVDKQSPLWSYLGQVGHRIRKLRKAQKGKGSAPQPQ